MFSSSYTYSSAPPTLPFELLESIAKLTDSNQLVTLSRTTRTLHNISEPLLYKKVECNGPEQARKALTAILRRSSAGVQRHIYVRDFSIQLYTGKKGTKIFNGHDPVEPLLPEFYQLLAKALSLMRNLDRLCILDIPHSASYVLKNCISQPLVFVSNMLPSRNLASWLQIQQRMEALIFPYYQPPPFTFGPSPFASLTSSALPNLQIIAAQGSEIKCLVPGRPIKSVSLDYPFDDEQLEDEEDYLEVLQCLALSTGPVESFGIHFRRTPLQHCILPEFPRFRKAENICLPSIRSLNIYTSRAATSVIREISDLHKSFPNLQSTQIKARVFPALTDTKWQLRSIADTLRASATYCAARATSSLSMTSDLYPADSRSHPPVSNCDGDCQLERVVFRNTGYDQSVHEYRWDSAARAMRSGKDQSPRDNNVAGLSSNVECFELDGLNTNLGAKYEGDLDVFRKILRRQEKQPSSGSESSSLLFLMSSVW